MMKDFLLSTMVAVLLVANGVSVASCQGDSPRQTLNEFSKALEKKDKDGLTRLLTNEPEYVAVLAFEEHSERYKLPKMTAPAPPPEGVIVATGGISPPNYVGEELLKYVVSFDLFFKQNRTITKIVDIRENGKEAFAKVEMAGWSADTGNGYAPILYDVLLYREEQGWKIFKMNHRNKGDEAYNETYKFYAKPVKTP